MGPDYAIRDLRCHVENIVKIPHYADMKLLLIEDDANVAEVLAIAFGEEGHEATIAYTGEEGLARLRQERPDAVLLDVRLPKMNGIEVLRRIRSNDQTLPVIIITGLATQSEVAEARELGVTDVIEKSYVLQRFSESLARVLNKQRPA